MKLVTFCHYTRQTKRGVFECEQPNCNGVDHFVVFYPYVRVNPMDDLWLYIYAILLGLAIGFLLFGDVTEWI